MPGNTEKELAIQRSLERLRQEQEAFDHEKKRSERWLRLQLTMGYVAVALLVVVLVFSLYVIFNHSTMPATVVAAASGALFVDVVEQAHKLFSTVLVLDHSIHEFANVVLKT